MPREARGHTTADHPSLDQALAEALAVTGGPAVIGPLWDPVATEFCFAAGVSATLKLRIGGKVGPDSGVPIDAVVKVEGLKHDAAMIFGGLPTSMGDAALVSIAVDGDAPIQIVLNTLRTQAYGTEVFTQFGIDLRTKRLIIVKSMQHFYAAFAPLAKKVIYMGSPGTASREFKTLTYRNVPRPMWPFDQ